MTTSELELILRGGRVIDPAQGIDGVMDVGILGGRVAAVAPALAPAPRTKMINVHGKLVLPGLIDTHAHIYEHVTGIFGLNADLVGIRSGVDRKSTRLNSSHLGISYAVFCLKKKKTHGHPEHCT